MSQPTRFIVLFVALVLCCSVLAADWKSAARKWAPLVKLAKGEKFRPSSVEFFLKHTKVQGGANPSPLKPENLPTCNKGCFLVTKQSMSDSETDNLPVFYGQDVSVAPAYAVVKHDDDICESGALDIEYWFFYPYNRGKRICIGIYGDNWCPCPKVFGHCVCPRINGCAGKWKSFGHHVGDWENIRMKLKSANEPVSISFTAHGDDRVYKYNPLNKKFVHKSGEILQFSGTHPVVYSAWGSHGARAAAGKFVYQKIAGRNELTDKTSDGAQWKTWKNLKFISYKKDGVYTGPANFFNYNGRWGNPKRDCTFWEKVSGECVLNSGPRGPSIEL